MRHGEAGEASTDAARPLTARGEAQALSSASGLLKLGVKIPVIWHSPYRRAAQTAAIVARVHGAALVVDDRFTPEASPVRAVDAVRGAPAGALIVAHMPILPGIVELLCGLRASFSTASVAHVVVGRPPEPSVLGRLLTSDFLEHVQ